MQDTLDSYMVELLVIPGCTCEAHGLAIQHAADCEAFEPELTAQQVRALAIGFAALYDRYVAQGRTRQMLTPDKRQAVRDAIRHADTLLGTKHRYSRD